MSRTRGKWVPTAKGGGCPLTNHPTTTATGLLSERCCCFISLPRLLCLLNLDLDIDLDIDIGVDLDFGLELDFHLDICRDLGICRPHTNKLKREKCYGCFFCPRLQYKRLLFEAKAHSLNVGSSRGDLIG